MGKKTNHSNTQPVFRIKTERNTNNAVLKHVGYFIEGQHLIGDEVVDIETSHNKSDIYGKNTDYITHINGYDITVNAYKTNILGSYLLGTDKFPVYNISLMYKKNIVAGYLINIYVYFTLDEQTIKGLSMPCTKLLDDKVPHTIIKNENGKEDVKFVKCPERYVNANVSGTYSINFELDEEIMNFVNKQIENSEEIAIHEVANYYTSANISIDDVDEHELNKRIKDTTDKIIMFYRKITDGINLPSFPSEKILLNVYIKPLYNNPLFLDVLKHGVDYRDKIRRIELNGDEDFEYSIPKNVFNINDVERNPEIVDNYFNLK
jgi:hypothetical protein